MIHSYIVLDDKRLHFTSVQPHSAHITHARCALVRGEESSSVVIEYRRYDAMWSYAIHCAFDSLVNVIDTCTRHVGHSSLQSRFVCFEVRKMAANSFVSITRRRRHVRNQFDTFLMNCVASICHSMRTL